MRDKMPSGREPWSTTSVAKTLWPPAPGTKRLRAMYGAQLVNVRYRHSRDGRYRYTTIELLVDHGALVRKPRGANSHELKLKPHETQLARELKQAGAHWDKATRIWHLSSTLVKSLRLTKRSRKRTDR